ncbi:hypothetical protein ACE2AJ_00330 [Aquihabitans daechungensis]|uniref:hypothetical protein n=1 Tax=Aquihabitans daechungensis TaxID=1052257 RepID=UPI003B9ED2B2
MSPNTQAGHHPAIGPARRAKGDGSVYRRADGRWVGRLSRRGECRSYYAHSEQEAEEKLRVARSIADRYGNLPDLAATVTTVIESYRHRRRRPHACDVPPEHVNDHLARIESTLGQHPVAFLTTDQVREDFLEPLAEQEDDTVFFEVYETLVHLLDYALKGWAGSNPAFYFDALPIRYQRPPT